MQIFVVDPSHPVSIVGSGPQPDARKKLHTLVTGPSGSGKTYLSNALRSRGGCAYDADNVGDLTGWFDATDTRVFPPPEPDAIFLDSHRFLWNRRALVSFLETHRLVYLFGISRNALEMTELFDKVYFLKVPPAILAQRLRASDRINPMGRTAYQIEYSLLWARRNEEKAAALDIQMVDGTRDAEQILSEILGHGSG